MNGVTFKTPEHFYQWSKFGEPAGSIIKQRILDAPTAKMATYIADNNKNIILPNFEQIKNDVMLNALRAKFTQHHDLRQVLLSTGEKPLIEHYMYDNYWADGGDGSGKNMLGNLLMQVRQELRTAV